VAQQDGGKVTEGTRVRMKADGRVYVITKAYEEGGRDVYNGMLAELTSALAEDSGGFVGFTADAFDVLP
jgi:predicted type IV restriction endonuclease